MPAIIVLAVITIGALTVLSFAVRFLFSAWLLVTIAILAWINFGRAAPTSNLTAQPPDDRQIERAARSGCSGGAGRGG